MAKKENKEVPDKDLPEIKTGKAGGVKTLPLLPLRDIVIFPGMMSPLFVGRKKSIKALDIAFSGDKEIMLSAQKEPEVDEPLERDIFNIGCIAIISQVLRLPDGAVKVLVEGKERAAIKSLEEAGGYLEVKVEPTPMITDKPEKSVHTLFKAVRSFFEKYVTLNQQFPAEVADTILAMEDKTVFCDQLSANLPIMHTEKQELLEAPTLKRRLEVMVERLGSEIEVQQVERSVRSRVKKQMEKSQRDYYLTEQMKAIQKELGRGGDSERSEFEELRDRIESAGMPVDVKQKALKELGRLEQMPPMSSEGTVSRNYIDWLLDVPWSKRSKDKLEIKKAREILDKDHYGLVKVKERIVEYLAVRKLVKKMKGPILCFVGPPGVGKTSLGRSIARAMNRKFVRFSLGGIRDEAEIRGHRRTYIGALPGRIIQSMKKAGTKNPVIMLDEIDKVGADFRGDPSSALLEALDPEQNNAFNDHYLEVDYDLSEVMFITTANTLHTIPRPLRDRMEIIDISGYTDQEKESIATKFLLPRQLKENGIKPENCLMDDSALMKIIRNYTRESGVRNLEREIGKVLRKIACKVAEKKTNGKTGKTKKEIITDGRLVEFLGEIKFRDEIAEKKSDIGIVTGLAWTELGGTILKIETTILLGKGKFMLTGKLGDVMKESAQAALSYIRSHAAEFGLKKGFHETIDIHIHIPEGAIPKDGPSAGITLATAMTSALLKIPVRHTVAMTGEITLRGNVLPIGGLKEKLLAAARSGISTVLIPEENERDLAEIPDNILNKLKVIPVSHIDDVLEKSLTKSPVKKRALSRTRKRVGSSKKTKIAARSRGGEKRL